jgi:hypothetical protein
VIPEDRLRVAAIEMDRAEGGCLHVEPGDVRVELEPHIYHEWREGEITRRMNEILRVLDVVDEDFTKKVITDLEQDGWHPVHECPDDWYDADAQEGLNEVVTAVSTYHRTHHSSVPWLCDQLPCRPIRDRLQ